MNTAADSAHSGRNFPPVRALLRGLKILEILNALRCCTVSEIVRAAGLPRPTVVRLLETLESDGYIVRNTSTGTYEPSPRVIALAEGFNADGWFVTVTTPILRALFEEIGWPSDVMMLRGDRMTVRNSSRQMSVLDIDRRFVGMESPLSVSSGGRAYLAYCSDTERDRLLQLVSNLAERRMLYAEIEETRRRGYSVRDHRAKPHIGSIAIPVMAGNSLVSTLNCVYLPNVATAAEVAQRCLPAMTRAAERIAQAFNERKQAPRSQAAQATASAELEAASGADRHTPNAETVS